MIGQPSGYVLIGGGGTPVGTYTDPACGTAPLSSTNTESEVMNQRFLCRFDFNSYFNLVLDQQRANIWTSVEHDVSPYTMVFLEAGYSRNRALRALSPSFALLNYPAFRGDHSYYPGQDAMGNPLPPAAAILWYGRPLGGGAPRKFIDYATDSIHTVAGIKGDFGGVAQGSQFEDWHWEVAGSWGNLRYTFGIEDALRAPVSDALNACGPDGDPADCWNPFYSDPPTNSAVLNDRIHGELKARTDTELTTVNADIGGPIVELPGGDLGLAVGVQTRREAAATDLDNDANEENYVFLVGGPDWAAERNILAAYGELILPFFDGFELQAAGRLENYDDVGSTFNPKVGISWIPLINSPGVMEKFRVRGTYATSFRAPSLLQVDGAVTSLQQSYNVTVDTMDADMDGDTTDPLTATSGTFIAVRATGNADLKPEEAVAITGGFEWELTKGLVLEADYWNYNYENLVVLESYQQIINEDYMDMDDPRVHRSEIGQLRGVDVQFVNAPTLKTDGIDFAAYYNIELDTDMALLLSTRGTYVLSFDIEVPSSMGTTTFEGVGNRNLNNPAPSIPALRINFPIQYTVGVHGIGVVARFISGYDNDDAQSEQKSIDPWVTFDLQYGFRIQEDDNLATMIKVGVLNVLDSDPPGLDAELGYDTRVHDPRGRIIYGRLTQEF